MKKRFIRSLLSMSIMLFMMPSIVFAGDDSTAPTLTASGKDIIGCYTLDGGTTWNVLVLGLDVK